MRQFEYQVTEQFAIFSVRFVLLFLFSGLDQKCGQRNRLP